MLAVKHVIVTGTNPVVFVFKGATTTIPIVALMLDPLKAGLVTSVGVTRR
jgi:putative tryptophan/tyrosine transport system substrate-binding protein